MKLCTKHIFVGVVTLVFILSGCSNISLGSNQAFKTDLETEMPSVDEITLTEDKPSIRIVSDTFRNESKRFDVMIVDWILEFKKAYKVDVIWECLPENGNGRDEAIDRLRTELMANKGPDVLLLACDNVTKTSLLIQDVNQAMHNGIFADISEYYDADVELGQESLNPTIMDAGVVNNARYVLPLRYNFPVAYVDVDQFESEGLNTDIFDSGIISLMDEIIQSENRDVAWSAMLAYIRMPFTLNFFPNLLDYGNQKVLITQDELVEYMKKYQAMRILQGNGQGPLQTDLGEYFRDEKSSVQPYWATSGFCMLIDDLEAAIHNTAMAKAMGVNMEMVPLSANDGSLVADVTYYGAVSAGCKNPELAYEFLRYLLTENFQWEKDNDVIVGPLDTTLGREGYPVRIKGSVQALAIGLNNQLLGHEKNQKKKELQLNDMTDNDVPLLRAEIDKVRFSIPLELELEESIRKKVDATTTEDQMIVIAEEWLHDLEWHLYEG